MIENYKYGSAEAISLAFVLVWFVGDVANFVGALRARLVPLVIATAVYFCFADTLLITQYLYYKAKNAHRARKHAASVSGESDVPDPTTPLLSRRMSENMGHYGHRRRSSLSVRRRGSHADDSLAKILEETESGNSWIKNTAGVIGVCLIGTAGWAIAWRAGLWKPTPMTGSRPPGDVAAGAQFFGYLSAVAYLGYVLFGFLLLLYHWLTQNAHVKGENTSNHKELSRKVLRRYDKIKKASSSI